MLKELSSQPPSPRKHFHINGAVASIALMVMVFGIVWIGVFEPFFVWR